MSFSSVVPALALLLFLSQAPQAYAYMSPRDFINQFGAGSSALDSDIPFPHISSSSSSVDPNIPFPHISSSSSSQSSTSSSSSSSSTSTSSSSSSSSFSSSQSVQKIRRSGGGNAPQANLINASRPSSSSSVSSTGAWGVNINARNRTASGMHPAAPNHSSLPQTGPSLAVALLAASAVMLCKKRGKENEE